MSYNVLIVDDSATTRKIIKRALPLTGIPLGTVSEADGGAAALRALHSEPIDLVLSDLNMPEMDGAALIEAMDASPELRHIPVVIISTEGSRPRLREIERPLVAGYLRKPFTPEQLKATLCSITEQV